MLRFMICLQAVFNNVNLHEVVTFYDFTTDPIERGVIACVQNGGCEEGCEKSCGEKQTIALGSSSRQKLS